MNNLKKDPVHLRDNSSHYQEHYIKMLSRRKKQILVVVLIIMIAIVISLFTILKKSRNRELLGVWQYNQYTEYEFSEKGRGCLCVDDVHYDYKYNISGRTIRLDFADNIVRDCEYTFSIKGNVLTLVGGAGTDKGTYKLNKML